MKKKKKYIKQAVIKPKYLLPLKKKRIVWVFFFIEERGGTKAMTNETEGREEKSKITNQKSKKKRYVMAMAMKKVGREREVNRNLSTIHIQCFPHIHYIRDARSLSFAI